MNSLITPAIYNFIIKDINVHLQQPLKEVLNQVRENIPYFHSEYVHLLVLNYIPIECSPKFVSDYLHLIIQLYQDNFKLSKDKKTVGLEENSLNTDDVYDTIINNNDHTLQTKLNKLEQFLMYCLFQLINFREKQEIINLYLVFKSNYSESITFFEKECPKENITILSFLSLQFYQTITLYNKRGTNNDKRSLQNKDYMLSSDKSEVYFSWKLKDEVSTLRDITLIRPTMYDLLVGFLTIKSGKYDRWYELFCDIRYSQLEEKYIFEFDHGS
jgi:hypothetical protein